MSDSDIFGFLDDISLLEAEDQFVPHPPTEEELAPFRRIFQDIPVHIQDASDQTQMLPASALPIDEPAHPTHQNAHPDHIDQDILLAESPLLAPCPLSISCVDQYGRHLIYRRGETTDDEIHYWLPERPICVNRGIQEEPERPDWLPEDWEMKCVTRTNGSSAGNKDKYYIEPGVKRRQFRSKREVLEFLETGKRRQYKRKAQSTAMPSNVNRPFEGTSSSSCLEASTSRQNEETPNLDSDTVPEKQKEETPPPPNVDSDQNPPKRPRGSSS